MGTLRDSLAWGSDTGVSGLGPVTPGGWRFDSAPGVGWASSTGRAPGADLGKVPRRNTVTVNRNVVLILVAGICEVVAALAAASIIPTVALAWAFGGLAAWFFAQLP